MRSIRTCGEILFVGLALLGSACGDPTGTPAQPSNEPALPAVSQVGSIEARISTVASDGGQIDPDGYLLIFNGTLSRDVGVNGTVAVAELSVRRYSVELVDLAVNCKLLSPNPQVVEVQAGKVMMLDFSVKCGPVNFSLMNFAVVIGGHIHVGNADGTVPLTSGGWIDHSPSWSPDGRRIAFTSDRDGNFEIYVMDADGNNQIRLTNDTAGDFSPTWSPGSRRIAFSSERDREYQPGHGRATALYTMNADGSGQIAITSAGAQDRQPAWSPDGTRIAFSTNRDDDLGIWLVNPDGAGAVKITSSENFKDGDLDAQPTWSPDGGRIAFVHTTQSIRPRRGIFSMKPDGSAIANMTPRAYSAVEPSWSPDGRSVAYTSYGNPNSSACGWSDCDPFIEVIGVDGTSHQSLIRVSASQLVWRPGPPAASGGLH